MPLDGLTIPAALVEQARLHPDAQAFTFIDYEVDPAGYAEALTWRQVEQRVRVVAAAVASCGSPGDRVGILAPQGLDYIVGFLGAMAAGCIAVPLPVPTFGAHDERVGGALRDCAPAALLTTSGVANEVVSCTQGLPGRPPAVIEVDALELGSPLDCHPAEAAHCATALLQYTSGSTRAPAGVVVTHQNIVANLKQVVADYCEDTAGVYPPDVTLVSWLPFYHDMGLLLGVYAPVIVGLPAVLTTPMAFLQKPARWIQMLAGNSRPFTAVPNFAFELAVRRTSDADMAGLDLGHVHTILSGSERIHAATLRRFTERFARFNLPASTLAPSYGLAEATLYVTSAAPGRRPTTARFDYAELSAGRARPCEGEGGSELVSVGPPRAGTVRIVDPETWAENPAGQVGEIWLYGDNVSPGYWHNPTLSGQTFGGRIVEPTPGTPAGPWLRTGDLGVISDGELFIIGRMKDLLIVDGRNHYPDDIEATVQEITGGRVAAIAIPGDQAEQLVVVIEVRQRDASDGGVLRRLHAEVTSAIAKSHGLRVRDVVLVEPGAIPITTSGKIRRSECGKHYTTGRMQPVRALSPG